MALEKVIVESEEDMPLEQFVKVVQAAIGSVHSAVIEGENCVVFACDCRDAENEITKLLDDSGVKCFVYDDELFLYKWHI